MGYYRFVYGAYPERYVLVTFDVPSTGIRYPRYQIIPPGWPSRGWNRRGTIPCRRVAGGRPGEAVPRRLLVSRKLVYREVCSEGSEPTKSGTDDRSTPAGTAYGGQKGRVSKHIFAKPVTNKPF